MSTVEQIELHYPLPIAKLYEEMRLETNPRLRTYKIVNLFEGISQYLVLVGLSIYLHQKSIDPEIEKLRSELFRPSLGHWIKLLKTVSKYLRPTDPQFLTPNPDHDYEDEPIGISVKFIREILGLENIKNVRLHHFLDTIVDFRNKKIGHGELSSNEVDKVMEPLEAAINQWLAELSTLYERHLLYISEVRLQKKHRVYFGTKLNVGISLESFQSEGEIDLDDNCVYLHLPTSNTYIPLSPFFVYKADTQVLYIYSNLSDQGEMRLHSSNFAHQSQEWLTISPEKKWILGSNSAMTDESLVSNVDEFTEIVFTPSKNEFSLAYPRLTPEFLANVISPYLNAIVDIQNLINDARRIERQDITISSISQRSPISVSLDGASEAIGLIKDTVVPWRRKHAEIMAHLLEQEKQAEIENKKAEVLEIRARAEKERTEIVKQRGEIEKIKIENEKSRLELQRAKVQLAIDILAQIAPNLSEADKINYVVRILPPLHTLFSSELEISEK